MIPVCRCTAGDAKEWVRKNMEKNLPRREETVSDSSSFEVRQGEPKILKMLSCVFPDRFLCF